jgi:hydroxymethylbilane synthase
MILAEAGLQRLNLTHAITHTFCPHTQLLPAVGQGTLAVEYRQADTTLTPLLEALSSAQLKHCTQAERALMHELEGGCQLPLGATAYWNELDGVFELSAQLLHPHDVERSVEASCTFTENDNPDRVGRSLAQTLLSNGGDAIKAAIAQV